jgi:hypothetical protein
MPCTSKKPSMNFVLGKSHNKRISTDLGELAGVIQRQGNKNNEQMPTL